MNTDNFLRKINVGGNRYIATARPSQYKRDFGAPQFFIQLWKINHLSSGELYAPHIKGWAIPSVQGYSVRTMNLDTEYSRFVEDFKAYESNKVSMETA